MENKTIVEQFPWAVVGAKAVIYERGSGGYRSIKPANITRVTNTRITLDGGRTFYLRKYADTLCELGVDVYRSATLIPTDDPRVEEARQVIQKQRIDNAAQTAADNFNKSRTVDNAQAAITALKAFIENNQEEEN